MDDTQRFCIVIIVITSKVSVVGFYFPLYTRNFVDARAVKIKEEGAVACVYVVDAGIHATRPTTQNHARIKCTIELYLLSLCRSRGPRYQIYFFNKLFAMTIASACPNKRNYCDFFISNIREN